jgi:hypothetical protein
MGGDGRDPRRTQLIVQPRPVERRLHGHGHRVAQAQQPRDEPPQGRSALSYGRVRRRTAAAWHYLLREDASEPGSHLAWLRRSLHDLPERILARDLAVDELQQVNAPHFEILPRR